MTASRCLSLRYASYKILRKCSIQRLRAYRVHTYSVLRTAFTRVRQRLGTVRDAGICGASYWCRGIPCADFRSSSAHWSPSIANHEVDTEMDTATLFVRMEQSAVTFRLGQVPTSQSCTEYVHVGSVNMGYAGKLVGWSSYLPCIQSTSVYSSVLAVESWKQLGKSSASFLDRTSDRAHGRRVACAEFGNWYGKLNGWLDYIFQPARLASPHRVLYSHM